MTDFGLWSLVPPILAIGLSIRTRQVIFSLAAGIFLGYLIIENGNPLRGFLSAISSFVDVFQNEGNTRIIIFTFLIGALIQLIKYSGGVTGFINWVQSTLNRGKYFERKLQASTAFVGFLIFIESNISILTVGTIFRPLFDKHNISREKLAYLADSSSAPSCILFPFNAWGAFIMGLLTGYEKIDPFRTLVYSIPFNFYALLTLALVCYLTLTGKDYGPMKRASGEAMDHEKEKSDKYGSSGLLNMVIPIAAMVLSMPVFLVCSGWDTGNTSPAVEKIWSSIGNGSGSEAVLNACFTAFIIAVILYFFQRKLNVKTLIEESLTGMKDMLTMAILMMLAFAIGDLCNELGTGIYVSGITRSWLAPELAPALVFLISAFIAFSTGTSWGTFAIMIAIAVPLSSSVQANVYLMVAAVLSGGVFGDHCSPISDTTLIASLAAGCNHIDHVRTQLPYALFTGAISFVMYILAGVVL